MTRDDNHRCHRQRGFEHEFARHFGGGQKAKPMTPPPDPATESDAEVQSKSAERKRQATAARGYTKTIATSPMGVPGEQQAGQATKLG